MNLWHINGALWAPLPSAPTHQRWLAIGLKLLAAFEIFFALLQSLKLIASDEQYANAITTAHLIFAPVLAVAALFFAARDRLPQAIMALAAVALTTWASELTSAQFTGIMQVLADVVRPVIAVLAIIMASCRTSLGIATVLVASVWLVWAWVTFLSDVVIFSIGVMLYGI